MTAAQREALAEEYRKHVTSVCVSGTPNEINSALVSLIEAAERKERQRCYAMVLANANAIDAHE